MKPIVLDTETKKAQIVMSAAVTTTAPDFTCSYLDTNGTLFNEGNQNGVLDGTTAVDVVDSPASTYRRIVSEITVYNADSVAVTITLILNDGGVSRIIEKIDLDPSQSYKLTDGQIGTKGAKGDMGDTPAFPAHVRLSLASGDPNPLTDLSAQTEIYAMQYGGDTVPIWNGTAFSAREFANNIGAALHASYQTVGNIYDLYMFDDSGTIRVGFGVAWASTTSRGTGAGTAEIETVAGVRANKNAITLRNGTSTYLVDARKATLVGLISPSVNGQVQWTKVRRELGNEYNLMPAGFDVCPGYVDNSATNTWTTAAVTNWTKANGGNGSDATFALCRPQIPQFTVVAVSTATAYARIGAAYDGLNVKQSAWVYTGWVTTSSPANNRGVSLAEGPHTASFCYLANTTVTFNADNGSRGGATSDPEETYMTGTILM